MKSLWVKSMWGKSLWVKNNWGRIGVDGMLAFVPPFSGFFYVEVKHAEELSEVGNI